MSHLILQFTEYKKIEYFFIGLFIYAVLHLHYVKWLLLYNLFFVTFGNILGGIIVAYIKIFLEKNIE